MGTRGTVSSAWGNALRSVSFVSTLALQGCASVYPLPKEAADIRARLDEAAAREIITATLLGRGGAVGAGPQGLPVFSARVNERRIEYVTNGFDELVGIDAQNGGGNTMQVRLLTKSTIGSFAIDLDKVTKIRLVATGDKPPPRQIAGYCVWVYQSNLDYIIINVSPDRLDDLMAALTFYAPKARLMAGMGL